MSERLDPDQEDLPTITLHMETGEFVASPINTTLFTFLGRLAIYNHIFVQTGDEDDRVMVGTYVFSTHSVYQDIVNFMVEEDFPMMLNRLEVPDCDVNAYNRMIEQHMGDVGDTIPDDWL